MELAAIYTPENRRKFLLTAAILIALIAIVDWLTKPYVSLGFLYVFPILLVAGFLPRWQIVVVSGVCAILHELFSNLPTHPFTRLAIASAGLIGTGLFGSEIIRNRQLAVEHVREVDLHVRLRRETEEQLELLVQSTPLAIVTVDEDGKILLGNEASQNLFAPADASIAGVGICEFLPALSAVVEMESTRPFRTELRCRGKRKNGDVFLAAVWCSRYNTLRGPRISAITVDLSEDLRDREDLRLDYLVKNTTILMSAVAHEIRNLCGAARVVYQNLSRVPALQPNEDFRVLGTLVEGLEKLATMELRPPREQDPTSVELYSLFDEIRVLIGPSYQEHGIEIVWQLPERLPLVCADRYGLEQVFLNLARNSQRAMLGSIDKKLIISSHVDSDHVVIRFEDTGCGIKSPDQLFKVFQQDADLTGLGLYISPAILKSFGGHIAYEPRSQGCCFAISLSTFPDALVQR